MELWHFYSIFAIGFYFAFQLCFWRSYFGKEITDGSLGEACWSIFGMVLFSIIGAVFWPFVSLLIVLYFDDDELNKG